MSGMIRKTSSLINVLSNVSHPFLSPKYVSKIQVAGMICKSFRDKDFVRPPAFNYKEKTYGLTASLFDKTQFRFDENTRLIIVDGPVASGKDKLARELADQFDMHYIPHANLDYKYLNEYGYDFRNTTALKLPIRLRPLDVHEFLANPKDGRATLLQEDFFIIRFKQYLDALNHIFNTGQGVVMNRSVFSNMVFVKTLIKMGFVSKTYPKYHNQTVKCLLPALLKPHLVIYLDTPVEVIRQNLKKRNNPVEINSPVFQPEVLKEMEDVYKFQYLQEISAHAELLVYDNSEGVDAEAVVEDMERVNLEDYDLHNPKMKDWRFTDEAEACSKRIEFSRDRSELEQWLYNIPAFDCDEMIFNPTDLSAYQEAFSSIFSLHSGVQWGPINVTVTAKVPGNDHPVGYNMELGDSVLFKVK